VSPDRLRSLERVTMQIRVALVLLLLVLGIQLGLIIVTGGCL
jgi:hypothetical protein